MMNKILVFLVTTLWIQLSDAVSMNPFSKGGCIILNKNQLYCLGGVSGSTYSSQVYGLDLSKDYSDLNTLNNAWTSLTPLSEPNSEFAIVQSGANGIFINGGSGSGNGKPLQYQSAIYDAPTNAWRNIVAGNATNSLAQAKGAVATLIPSSSTMSSTAYIWGGVMDQTIGSVNTTYSGTFLTMDPLTGTWNPSLSGNSASLGYTPRIGHSMVNNYGTIYLFGGQEANYASTTNTYSLTPATLSTIPSFDTTLLSWSVINANGQVPSPRSYHTTTASTVSTIILYGGATPGTNTPVTDTFYRVTISLGTAVWYQVPDGGGSPGPRFGHASVTYDYDTILIIGGIDGTGAVKNDVNVFSYYASAWRNSFSASDFYTSSPPSSGNGNTGSSSGPNNINYGSGYDYSLALQQGIAGGIGAGGLVLFGLIGLALGWTIKKSRPVNDSTTIGFNHHPMDNMVQGNGYAKVELESTSGPDNRPLPPAPTSGEAASYLQQHPSNIHTQPHPY